MTTTDWFIDILLIVIVLRQIREERLTARFLLLPLGIVGWVAHQYLHGLPTGGNDLVLVSAAVAAGLTLGAVGGLVTRLRSVDGQVRVRAGWAAAGLWVASMSARLGFIIWITHSSGEAALGRFSLQHHLTGAGVWQTSLVLLALSEVVARVGVIALRGARLAGQPGEPAPVAQQLVTR